MKRSDPPVSDFLFSVTEEFVNSPSNEKSGNILNHDILANLDQVYSLLS